MRVSHELNPSSGLTVNLIRSWRRGEIEAPVMSTSSGPKAMTCNLIFEIFDRFPGAAKVMMLRGEYLRSIPFLVVVNYAGHAVDMAGEAVVIEP